MIKKKLVILKVVSISFIPILIIGLILFKFLDLSMNKYSERFFSDDKAYFAQISETNGGATTGFITGVTLTNAKTFYSNSVRLSAWSGNSSSVFIFDGSSLTIKISWLNQNTLKVAYSDCDKVYKKNKSWRDIKIVYEGQCERDNN